MRSPRSAEARVGASLASLLLLILGGAPVGRLRAQDSLPPRTLAALEERIRGIMAARNVPSVGVALVTRDSVMWVAGLGKADVAGGREASAESLYRIGSTSKAFVSLLLLQLEQEGTLRLTDRVAQYAPEIRFVNRWEDTDPVRLVHLLEHTTGWDDLALRDYANNDSTPLTLKQGLDYTPRTRESRWRPGTRVSYCNSGPPVAAYIAEKLEGRPFEDLVRERLFLPIGMATATYLRDPALRDRMVTLYHGDGRTPYPYWHVIERPAGSINASPRDMAAYVRFLLNRGRVDGRVILPAAAIEGMERPRSSGTAKAGLPVGYGLHLATYVDSGFVWVGHDGGVPGGTTIMAYRPEAGVGFTVMLTGGDGRAAGEISRLVRGFLTRDEPRPVPPAAIPVPDAVRLLGGWYEPDNPRVQLLHFADRIAGLTRVMVNDSALVLKPLLGKTRTYLPVSARLFRGVDEPVPTLALTSHPEDGRDNGIEQMGYLLPAEYHRVSGVLAGVEVFVTAAWLLGLGLTLLFALIWVPRRLLRRLTGITRYGPRLWPLLAALTIVVFVAGFVLTSEDAIEVLGQRTAWSVTLWLTTLLFPVAAVAGLISSWRADPEQAGSAARRFGLIVSLLHVVVAGYLGYWGMIGWAPWG